MRARRPAGPALVGITLAGLLLAAGAAAAQDAPEESGPERTVWLFETLCFDNIPDIDAIAGIAAEQGFVELAGKERDAFQPELPAEELRAWRFEDYGRRFVLSVTRSLPDADFRADVPDFAEATAYACSLSNQTPDPAAEVLDAMILLMGREPENAWEQPPLQAQSWSGEGEDLLVFVYLYSALSGGPGGLLSISTFVKS